jgi:hypothetical protein
VRLFLIILFVVLAGLVVACSISFIAATGSNEHSDMLSIFIIAFIFTVVVVGVMFSLGSKEKDNLQGMEDRISKINEEIYQLKKWHK